MNKNGNGNGRDDTTWDDETPVDPPAIAEHGPICEQFVILRNRLDSFNLELGRVGREFRLAREPVKKKRLRRLADDFRPVVRELQSTIDVLDPPVRKSSGE